MRRSAVLVAVALAAWGLAACVPPQVPAGPVQLAAQVTALTGSRTAGEVPVPGVAGVLTARVSTPAGFAVDAFPAVSAGAGQPVVAVTVVPPMSVAAGVSEVLVAADGCAVDPGEGSCPAESVRAFRIRVEVTVVTAVVLPPDGMLDAVADPSPERVDAATVVDPAVPDWRQLTDELLVTIGSADAPGSSVQAELLASSVGAVLIGGVSDVGFYQFRFPFGSDLTAATLALEATSGVAAYPSTVGGHDVQVVPAELTGAAPSDTWQWDLIDASSAWDKSTGSSVKVGVIDNGVYGAHADLRVTYNSSEPIRAWTENGQSQEEGHGTHVAGLACARQNNTGVVGAAWGCEIVAAQASGPTKLSSDANVTKAMWDLIRQRPKVINMSLGPNLVEGGVRCPDQEKADRAAAKFMELHGQFYRAWIGSTAGSQILWTFSAGNNCVSGNQGAAQLASEYPHVVSVAAVNSDRQLATFSNTTAEIAAPGGVGVGTAGTGSTGVWSTSTRCAGTTCRSDYEPMYGTSQAAPIVAGVAALVFEKYPSLTPSEVAACLVESGTPVAGFGDKPSFLTNLPDHAGETPSMKLVNANLAVECGQAQFAYKAGIAPAVASTYSHATCAPDGFCMAVGVNPANTSSVIVRSDNAGRNWTESPLPFGYDAIGTIDCPTRSHCVALVAPWRKFDFAMAVTGNQGDTWTLYPLPRGHSLAVGPDCPTATECRGVYLTYDFSPDGFPNPQTYQYSFGVSNDGGRTWTTRPVVVPGISAPLLRDVSCSSPAMCAATVFGPERIWTNDNGATWTRSGGSIGSHGVLDPFAEVECATDGTCVYFDNPSNPNVYSAFVHVSTDGGHQWRPAGNALTGGPPGTFTSTVSASCASLRFCALAIAPRNNTPGAIFHLVDAPVVGTPVFDRVFEQPATILDCSSPSLCVATNWQAELLTNSATP